MWACPVTISQNVFPNSRGQLDIRLNTGHTEYFLRFKGERNEGTENKCGQPMLRSLTEAKMFRLSKTESAYVQTFVRSCPDFRAFNKLGCDDQVFVPSSSDIKICSNQSTIRSERSPLCNESKSARF